MEYLDLAASPLTRLNLSQMEELKNCTSLPSLPTARRAAPAGPLFSHGLQRSTLFDGPRLSTLPEVGR